MSQFYVNLVWS